MRSVWLIAVVECLIVPWHTFAQDGTQQQTPPAPAPYVLHAYANLVQAPTLILGADFLPVPPLSKDQISIRLDAGPAFHPTQMHREGNDPIALAILIDASGGQQRLLRPLPVDLEKAARASLTADDHVTVFAIDCALVRSAVAVPAIPPVLKASIHSALSTPGLHSGNLKPSCANTLKLWDGAAQAVQALTRQSGRKVLFVITGGVDHNSVNNWNALKQYASEHSVAIFGLRDIVRFAGDTGYRDFMPVPAGVYYASKIVDEDHYTELCQSTGGLIMTTPAEQLTASLERILAMVRGRYILEFPRPDDSTPGKHVIQVTVPSEPDFVTTAGVTIELPDAARSHDPTTVPSSPSPAVMGKRRILSYGQK